MNDYIFNVRFLNGNAIGNPPSDIPALEGNTIELPYPNDLTMEGYQFTHWAIYNEQFETISGIYHPGDIYIMPNHDVVFYPCFYFIYTYQIQFHKNGNHIPNDEEYIGIDHPYKYTIPLVDDQIPTKDPTDEGTVEYTFLGYTFKEVYNSSDPIYQPGDVIDVTGDIVLYPHYEYHLHIFYNTNGGTPETILELNTYHPGDTALVASVVLEKKGNTFSHYTASPNPCETKETFSPGEAFKFDRSFGIIFHAVFEKNFYNVIYHMMDEDPNGDIKLRCEYESESSIIYLYPEKEGHTFVGWYLKEDPNTIFVAGNTFIIPDYDLNFYPKFEVNSYTVSYDTGSGLPRIEDESAIFNSEYTITNIVPKIPNTNFYQFLHWLDQSDAKTYQTGEVLIMPARNISLLAIYDNVSCTVTYDLNGGTGMVPPSQKVVKGEPFILNEGISIDTIYRIGHTMIGWASDPNALIPEYEFGGQAVCMTDRTLYAVWKKNVYHVYYDKNTTDTVLNMPSTQTGEFDTYISLYAADLIRENEETEYAFLGWNTNDIATEAEYFPGGQLKIPSTDITLFAIWGLKVYSFNVVFDTMNGIGGPQPIILTGNHNTMEIEIPEIIPSREESKFIGWDINPNESNPKYQPGDTITITSGTFRLYAIWQSTSTFTYKLEFDPVLGTNGPDTLIIISETMQTQSFLIPSQIPILNGYVFNGWVYQDSVYQPGEIFKMDIPGTTTLIASYLKNEQTFKLILDYNDGTGKTTSITYTGTEDTHAFVLPDSIPTRTGYTFTTGWTSNPDGTGNVVLPGGKTEEYKQGTYTLYANWAVQFYSLFYSNDGDESVSNLPKTILAPYDSETPISTDVPTKPEHLFRAWRRIEDTSSEPIRYSYDGDHTTIHIIQDTTLVPIWTSDTITIRFELGGSNTSIAEVSGKYGTAVFIPDTIPKKQGYDFIGWSTNRYGDGVLYQPGGSIILTSKDDFYLYAIYSDSYVHVFYDPNGGKGAPEAQSVMPFGSITITDRIPYQKTHSFLGWSTQKDNTSQLLHGGEELKVLDEDVVLYAIWKENPSYVLLLRKIGGVWRRLPFFN